MPPRELSDVRFPVHLVGGRPDPQEGPEALRTVDLWPVTFKRPRGFKAQEARKPWKSFNPKRDGPEDPPSARRHGGSLGALGGSNPPIRPQRRASSASARATARSSIMKRPSRIAALISSSIPVLSAGGSLIQESSLIEAIRSVRTAGWLDGAEVCAPAGFCVRRAKSGLRPPALSRTPSALTVGDPELASGEEIGAAWIFMHRIVNESVLQCKLCPWSIKRFWPL